MQKRDIFETIRHHLTTEEVVIITGQRQVGKTTTLKWILDQIESKNKLYIDLERLDNRLLFEEKNYDNVLKLLESQGLKKTEKLYLAIDEIQLSPNLPSVVKYLYDHFKIKFFLSGSSSYYIKNLFSESMAGRKQLFEMYPLCFGEFLEFKNVPFTRETRFEKMMFHPVEYERLKAYYNEFVEYGGMPKVVLEPDFNRKKELLQEIFSSYINLDVQTLSGFRKIKEITNLISLLSARIGQRLNITKLSQITGITRPTIIDYIEFFEKTYLLKLVPLYTSSEDVRQSGSKKVYFLDTGIAGIVADVDAGCKFENAVFNQLRHRNANIAYYNKQHVGEIDFIVDNTALEVKINPASQDKEKLESLAKRLGLKQHFLVGKDETKEFGEYVWGGAVV